MAQAGSPGSTLARRCWRKRGPANREHDNPGVRVDLPVLWIFAAGNDADRRLPVFLRVSQRQHAAASQARGLLCVLFLRFGEMPSDSGAERLLPVALDRETEQAIDLDCRVTAFRAPAIRIAHFVRGGRHAVVRSAYLPRAATSRSNSAGQIDAGGQRGGRSTSQHGA